MKITVRQLKQLIKEQVEENLFSKPVQEFDTAGYPSRENPKYPSSWKAREDAKRATDPKYKAHQEKFEAGVVQRFDKELMETVKELLERHSMTDIFKALYKAQAWKKRGL